MSERKKTGFFQNNSQLLIPLVAIGLLLIFNLIRDPSFFSVNIGTNNDGYPVLQGNLQGIVLAPVVNHNGFKVRLRAGFQQGIQTARQQLRHIVRRNYY